MTTATAPSLLYPHRGGHLRADDDAGFEEGRVYYWGDYALDSVTSIIKSGVPKGEALTKWAAKSAAEWAVANLDEWRGLDADEAVRVIKAAPFQKRDDAADLGTNVHDWAEALVLGQPLPKLLTETAKVKARLFEKWLIEYRPEFIAAECWVYNLRRRYAGRFDALADIKGFGRTLIDYKSGKGAYAEVGLQLAALRNAEFIGLADGTTVDMPTVDECAVLHIMLRKTNFKRVRAGAAEWMAFQYAQQVAEWRKTSDDVIGGPVPLPAKYPPRPQPKVDPSMFLD